MRAEKGADASRAIEIAALTAVVLAISAAFVAWPSDAMACGGFFCNQGQPVNQADENIVFSANDDGSVTAIIQIRYSGEADKFAWMLPVYGKPEVDVGSSTVFNRLNRATNQSYNRNSEVKGTCKQRGFRGADAAAAAPGGASDAGAESGDGNIDVVDQGSVGPYNYTTISVAKDAEDPAKEALNWLESNGYDLTDIGPELVREYLQENMNLIAFKLQKDAGTGEIRPVKITYNHPQPMIPLKLTAVAAQEDMGVRVWVAGDGRAVPTQFDGVKLNPAAINWFRPQSTYERVISQAADEVGGRGFVTEYAGDSSIAENSVFTENDESRWNRIKDPAEWEGREGELLAETLQAYWPRFGNSQWDGMTRVIRKEVPLPEDVTVQEFGQDRFRAVGYDRSTANIEGFDPASYLDALETNVVEPVRSAEELIQGLPYLTRMFTTVSPGEMTRDPVFEIKGDLPDVDRTRTAEQTIYCGDEEYYQNEAPWKMVLPDDTVVWGEGRNWPFNPGSINAAKEATDYGMTGEPETVEDNSEEIQQIIEEHNAEVDKPTSASDGSDGSSGGGSGAERSCSTAAGGAVPAGWLAALLLFLVVRVRRR